VQERWEEYIEDLCDKNNKPQEEDDMHLETDTEEDVKGPPILFSEFEAALSQLNKKLSWCWQTCATRLEVSQGHQT